MPTPNHTLKTSVERKTCTESHLTSAKKVLPFHNHYRKTSHKRSAINNITLLVTVRPCGLQVHYTMPHTSSNSGHKCVTSTASVYSISNHSPEW